jgi:hypothetical protein
MRAPLAETSNPFVPTLERARAQHLPIPDGDPVEQDRWAALITFTTFVRRTSWKEETHAAAATVQHLGRGAPPLPQGWESASWVTVDDIQPFGPCTACLGAPGSRPCRVCKGAGTFTLRGTDRILPCSCKGQPIVCPTCRGEGTTNRILLRYFQDEPKHLRELTVPSHLPCYPPLFGLESAMEQSIDLQVEPPDELRCHDLTGRAAGTAYRGGERLVRPSFFGHDFGDTIDRTLASFKGLAGGAQIVRYEVRAFAWPVLRVRYPDPKDPGKPRDLALFVTRQGGMHLVGA